MNKKMKNTFGKIKSKLLVKMTQLFENNNKEELKNILRIIKEDKDFQELYLFYDDIEKLELSQLDSATLYVETIEPMLNSKLNNINETCKKISQYLNDIEIEKNELYENLDALAEKSTLSNLDKKVIAKKKLIAHLNTKKEIKEEKNEKHTNNENMLMVFLTSDFNSYFSRTLSEDDKSKLKEILNLKQDVVEQKVNQLSEMINGKIESILNESKDQDITNKLEKVKEEIQNISPTKYNYYRLLQLKNGLD
jgi:hypothetical protein